MTDSTRICKKCGEEKPIDSFYSSVDNRSGKLTHASICNKCSTSKTREYVKKHPDKNKKWQKDYYERHKSKINEKSRIKSLTPEAKQKKKEYTAIYQKTESRKESSKRYRETHRDEIKQRAVNYKDKARQITKERLKTDINFKIKTILRTRVWAALNGNVKKSTLSEYLGCDILFFRGHIESLWSENMSWENYGLWGWHIDHIIPCASFDLSKREEQLKCFHYTNLQPLWRIDNIRKGDRIQVA